MSDRIEIQGKTVEAAVSEALLRMGARRDEVEIKVLEEPKSGFLGILGGRAAKVLVRKKRSRGRGGSGRDFRQDDNDYQAHNLSEGRGRGSRRKPSGGSGGSRPQKDEAQDSGRDEKSRSRRGSRGRGGRGRSQEAGGRDQAQGGQQDNRREQPVKAEKQEQTGGRSSGGGRSRNDRSRRGAPNSQDTRQDSRRQDSRRQDSRRQDGRQAGRQDNRQDTRQDGRQDNRRQDGRQDKRQDSRPEARSEGRPESRPESRPERHSDSRSENRSEYRRDNRPARQENVRAEARTEETPSRPVEGKRNQRREAPAPAPAPVENITPVVEKKEEVSVAAPKKQKKSFGGLGSRLREKKAAEKAAAKAAEAAAVAAAAPAETPAVAAPTPEPVATRESAPAPAPSRDYSHDSRSTGRRGPSRQSEDYADEVILSEISGIKYAKPVGEVTDEGLDDALTELTDGLLARAGFPCRCETHPGEYRQIKVTTDDASAGMLIGRHGQTIDAVEHLVERMASNAIDARARINLDINNYRQRREEDLAERVKEAAESIRENGRPVHVEPMSARERRLVHMYAADVEGIRTFTMDRSGGKHVVIAGDNEASQEAEPAGEQPDY